MRTHKLRINGKEVTPEEFHRDGPIGGFGAPSVTHTYSDAKPLSSISMRAANGDQAKILNAAIKQEGIQGVEWNERTGRCTITSRRGRAQAMPVFGKLVHMDNVHDTDGSYGDG